jgi:L-rhamnonate dehydratase
MRCSEDLVARTREQVGPVVELMVDAWISLDVETAVRVGEALGPYRIRARAAAAPWHDAG